MKLAIVGSRTISEEVALHVIREVTRKAKSNVTGVVSGGAAGVDTAAEAYAKEAGLTCKVFKPQYGTYGKRAPLVRNEQIVTEADAVLAVWDGKSNGTNYAVEFAKEIGKPLHVVTISEHKGQMSLFDM